MLSFDCGNRVAKKKKEKDEMKASSSSPNYLVYQCLSQKHNVQQSTLQDELCRLKIWVGNIGAHRTDRSSLQYRLRDASHLKDQVSRLVRSVHVMLQIASSIIRGDQIPWDQVTDEDDDSSPDERFPREYSSSSTIPLGSVALFGRL